MGVLIRGLAGRIRQEIELKDYLYYGIGGPAQYFAESPSEKDIPLLFAFAKKKNLAIVILGNGTNLLVRDGGIRGLVLYYGSSLPGSVKVLQDHPEDVLIQVPAYFSKASLLDLALKNSWGGLEFSAGIPGTLGGGVYMNAGTKWGSYASVIERVHFYSQDQGFFSKSGPQMGFKYRGQGEPLLTEGRALVLSVELKLKKSQEPHKIRALVDEILAYRGEKQPLELPSCGSVFKNPENSLLGAGRLIEACGLKGKQRGQAQVSLKHANFILNLGGARASDVEALIEEVQATVLKEKGVSLERELIILGDRLGDEIED